MSEREVLRAAVLAQVAAEEWTLVEAAERMQDLPGVESVLEVVRYARDQIEAEADAVLKRRRAEL